MKTKHTMLRQIALAPIFAAFLTFGLTSCEKETPAEEAADDIEDAAEEAGDAIEEATD